MRQIVLGKGSRWFAGCHCPGHAGAPVVVGLQAQAWGWQQPVGVFVILVAFVSLTMGRLRLAEWAATRNLA